MKDSKTDMDCTAICLLAAAVHLTQLEGVKFSKYCIDVRTLSVKCKHDIELCAARTPNLLLYCLTVNEYYAEHVDNQLRCLSNRDFPELQHSLLELYDSGLCDWHTTKKCDCYRKTANTNLTENVNGNQRGAEVETVLSTNSVKLTTTDTNLDAKHEIPSFYGENFSPKIYSSTIVLNVILFLVLLFFA